MLEIATLCLCSAGIFATGTWKIVLFTVASALALAGIAKTTYSIWKEGLV